MGTGEGGRRRRRMEGDDEEYVLEAEEEEYGEELSSSSCGEEGEGSDAEYQEDEEDEEDETPRPERRTNPAAVRSRQRRYEEDDSGGEEGEGSDAEYQEDEEDEEDETPRPKRRTNPAAVRSRQRRYEEDDDYLEELEEDEEVDDYLEDLDEEEEAPRPKRMTKCGGRGQKGKLPRAAEGSNRRRHEEEDMDFYPDLDEEEEEDMDFDPEVEDEEAEEDEEEEDFSVSHNRKVRVNNTVRRKPASKHRHRNKKNSTSKVSRRKVDSAKAGKAAPVRRRRKRSVIDIDHYEEDEDFIVEDQVEVNRQSRKKARVGRQIEVDHPVPVVEEDIWPTVESDTSDFDFVTSDEEPEDVEPAVVEPVRVTVRKGRKRRISGLESSSDSEFHVSDKELGDFRETEPLEAQPMLPASPRRISVTRNGEGKGKEKKEPEESGRPTCGICLSVSEEQKMTMQGVLNCCSHYFCFTCIIEWSRVESRCPLCKRRFTTITKSSKADLGLELINSVIRVEERDQIYQPTEDEIRRWLDPYENVVCIECNQGGDDSLMLLCDICDSSAHTYCVGLGREVPEGSWYCGGCRVSSEGPSYPRSPVNSNSEEFGTFERSPLMNPRQTFRGIDLNVPPREIPGENHLAESQASTMGVLTPSGRLATYARRRQINEMISILLSRPRPAISPEVGHSGVQHSGSVSRIEPNHRNFRAPSEANTSQHSGSVPRTEPNHRNFEAASEANTSQTLARRRRINEWISILLSRPRTTINPEVGHSGVPRTEPNHRNFHASLEANTSQLSGSVPRTEPNHRNFGATSDANTSQNISTRDADLSRRRRINGYLDVLLSRPRSTNSPDMGNNGVQNSGSVPGFESNHRNFHAPSEANTSQTLLDDIQNQHTGFPLVQAQSNFAPCISVDGNNFQQTEGVKSNVKHMCSISPR